VQGCEEGLEIRWWDLDTPKVFRRPGTNFRYRREPSSNFRVCPLFGTPPSPQNQFSYESMQKKAKKMQKSEKTKKIGSKIGHERYAVEGG
jgi:hypothetical protein